ncbi:MAG TPA: 3-hydroxyacyl-CoA dehydrogenase NAD-binding domain-containing protein [Acidobacteriota bacterium]|nr:3-hydroxyacyl-CoA dehydrogenase NAD-binding domain-containing protein [Acidobacteriota bacterium]
MEVKTITVLGAGIMGSGIAHVAAMGGFLARMYDVDGEVLRKAHGQIRSNLQKGVELNKVTLQQMETALSRLSVTASFEEAAQADFVIEAVPETMELKIETYAKLDRLAPPHTIFASNTSSLSITEMAAVTARPQKFIGMHFFNPVHKMKLVEIIRALETSDETFRITDSVGKQMGKETVSVRESPGFVTSRINAMIGNEAFYMLQEGIGSPEDIDKAIKLGLNHPMGPFEMGDLVGLDTRLATLTYLHKTLGEKYRPCPLLIQYVKAGRLGKKAGKGVYDYSGDKK